MKKVTEKYTILYGRLSQEDRNVGESDSIQNQRLILEKYAEENGFSNCKFMFDDGVSGTTFNRLAWNEVMEMIENNEVENLIVKDLSRLGRDYLQTGHLMEIVFPTYNVRFIAMTNGVDSKLNPDNDMSVFYNIMNEWYAKDCSKKIRAVKKMKAESGERIAVRPPYGYKKNPENPKQIIPDEISSEIVRKIFQLCVEGRGPSQIAKQLTNEQILNPSNYCYQQTGVALSRLDTTRPYIWAGQTIVNIIGDESYIGNTINLKHTSVSYKNKKQIIKPEDEWLRFENTHKEIISKNTWKMAQSVREQKKRTQKCMETPNMFSGLVFCADCDKAMVLSRAHTMDDSKNNFNCATYRKRGKEECTAHYLRETQLIKMVLDDLKRVTHFARQDEKLFTERINQKNSTETRKAIIRIQKEIDTSKRRDIELTTLFKRLYEDNVIGRLTNETFDILSSEYTTEQAILRENSPKLEQQMELLKNSLSSVEQFIERAKKYTDIAELTSEILRTFIDKIVVGEKVVKYSRNAEQCVWIHYRDIGLLDGATKENDIAPPAYDFEMSKSGELIAV